MILSIEQLSGHDLDGGVCLQGWKTCLLHACRSFFQSATSVCQIEKALGGRIASLSMCRQVHSVKEEPMISRSTRQACDYIQSNVKRGLSVEEIARYYFNRKFYAEMGVRVGEYIKRARCEYAKVELLTTHRSIQDISDSLHFGTRNYFCRVFREIVGVTPAAYREQTVGVRQ